MNFFARLGMKWALWRALRRLKEGDAASAVPVFRLYQGKHALADFGLAAARLKELNERAEPARPQDWDELIGLFSSAIALNPRFADAFMMRGIARIGKGDADSLREAEADLKRCVELNPAFELVAKDHVDRIRARLSG